MKDESGVEEREVGEWLNAQRQNGRVSVFKVGRNWIIVAESDFHGEPNPLDPTGAGR
jgi:hypothetical protein